MTVDDLERRNSPNGEV